MKTRYHTLVSWSGGKNGLLALQDHLQTVHGPQKWPSLDGYALLNMCYFNGNYSIDHGVSNTLIQHQAQAMGVPLIQGIVSDNNYRETLYGVLSSHYHYGLKYWIAGDISLQSHRDWVESLCREVGIEPLFPLWGKNPLELLNNWISQEYQATIVSVHKEKGNPRWLGKTMNASFVWDMINQPYRDPCGENGEYHTFVTHGPLFRDALVVMNGIKWEDSDYYYQELKHD